MISNSDDQTIREALHRSPEAKALMLEMRSRTTEILDPYMHGARSLLVAHGAAIFACLQYMSKDTDMNIRSSVAFFAGVFCFGFVMAGIGSFFGTYAKQQLLSYEWEGRKSSGLWDLVACGACLLVSFLILMFSVGIIGLALMKGSLGA